jgi:hypothetical protein
LRSPARWRSASRSTQPVVRSAGPEPVIVNRGNPLFRDLYTADPAPLVVGGALYLLRLIFGLLMR